MAGPGQRAWAAGVVLNGTGSSFAAPAIETWTADVHQPPYSITLNYSSSSSGQGRYEFTNQTTDFAASDTGYVSGSVGTTPPSFPFIFVPVTAAGVAFMYDIPGLPRTLQLSSYTACAVMTGGITNWDDSHIAADNPGVSLPNLTIKPVTESDTAGTNYVLEEWCIAEQPALWAAFAQHEQTQSGGPTDGVPISQTSPTSNWPGILPNGLDDSSTTAVAGDIATNPGAIGAVQLQYAVDDGFTGSNPAKAVASVKNASGAYTQPTPVDVASALAYATQLPDGTHKLDFNGVGAHVYNPSTYSYLLSPTTGWPASKGAVMSAFVNYVLTLGQQKAPSRGYASLGLSLERYGINAVTADVPGAVAVTSAENAAYACGDLTPTDVAAGRTTPTCGVTNVTAPLPPPNGGNGGKATSAAKTGAKSSSGHSATGSGGSGAGVATAPGGVAGADPGVALTGQVPLATTGIDPVPIVLSGAALVGVGWWMRRRLLRVRPADKGR
ncbi:MAG TPA: substrate-binding domain-containing protein [Acidimicrobiales bacterium]|nr:substrate-binding domain-containing protein [Acidimicrobiales bacterium]